MIQTYVTQLFGLTTRAEFWGKNTNFTYFYVSLWKASDLMAYLSRSRISEERDSPQWRSASVLSDPEKEIKDFNHLVEYFGVCQQYAKNLLSPT